MHGEPQTSQYAIYQRPLIITNQNPLSYKQRHGAHACSTAAGGQHLCGALSNVIVYADPGVTT
ncbi:MAG: hypothetical protein ABSD89_06995 [Halobacteriota archaeon]